jgi:sortase A
MLMAAFGRGLFTITHSRCAIVNSVTGGFLPKLLFEVVLRLRVLRFTQRLFLGVGVVILAYVGGMVAHASVYQRYQARMFEHKLELRELATSNAVDVREGDLVGKLEIPRIGISVMVLEGVEAGTLQAGAGHVPGTADLGAEGNAAIAGHRDTFFRDLRGIRPGDRMQVSTLQGTYIYIVDSTRIVAPEETAVLESKGYPELTLITCYPFYFI